MATLNIRLDDKLKDGACLVLEKMGVSPSELIRNVFQYIADNERLPIKVTMSDNDNYEATKEMWATYNETRKFPLAIIDSFKSEPHLPDEQVTKMFASIDKFIATSNIEIVRLVKAEEWSDLCVKLKNLGYILKNNACISANGHEVSMYSEITIEEFRTSFFELERSVYELMLRSRYL